MNLTSNGRVREAGLSPTKEKGWGDEEKEGALHSQQLLKIADLHAI